MDNARMTVTISRTRAIKDEMLLTYCQGYLLLLVYGDPGDTVRRHRLVCGRPIPNYRSRRQHHTKAGLSDETHGLYEVLHEFVAFVEIIVEDITPGGYYIGLWKYLRARTWIRRDYQDHRKVKGIYIL
jgi:hypothetical protein